MTTLILTRGVPASGKSTFAQNWVDLAPGERVRINRDDIRHMLFGKYWGVDEKAVTQMSDAMLRRALSSGKSVILDNTNLQEKNVIDILKIASEFPDVEVEFKDFPISFQEAFDRDFARDRHVGREVLLSFFDRYLGGVKKNTFPPVPELPDEWKFSAYEEIEGLPHAVLVDIDGTLAHHEGIRSPYDVTRYHLDEFDEIVAQAVYSIARYAGRQAKIIVMSGRDAAYRKVLEDWLDDNGFVYNDIFMRPVGDQRNDAVVKNELFDTHILGRYNVDIVFDDRDRVVKMWRQKGLKVFQVAPGDF